MRSSWRGLVCAQRLRGQLVFFEFSLHQLGLEHHGTHIVERWKQEGKRKREMIRERECLISTSEHVTIAASTRCDMLHTASTAHI